MTGRRRQGACSAPRRIERALSKKFAPEAIDGVAIDPSDLLSDMHGSAEYRANLVKVMAARAVASIA